MVFSEQEQTVRKKWLQLFIALTTVNLSCAVCKFSYLYPANLDPSAPAYFNGILIVSLCLGMSFNYTLFHCAYKKAGTKLLTLSLAFACITILTLIILTLGTLLSIATKKNVEFSLFYNTHSLIERILMFTSYILGPIFYLFSIRLRRINKAHKKARKLLIIEEGS